MFFWAFLYGKWLSIENSFCLVVIDSGKAFADGNQLPDKHINCLQDQALGFGVGGRRRPVLQGELFLQLQPHQPEHTHSHKLSCPRPNYTICTGTTWESQVLQVKARESAKHSENKHINHKAFPLSRRVLPKWILPYIIKGNEFYRHGDCTSVQSLFQNYLVPNSLYSPTMIFV